MLRSLAVLLGAFISLTAVSSSGQEVVLSQLYGNGVHAYFTGDYVKAFDQLTTVADAGSRDPRVYYFRGLAYLKLGRSPEAVEDFKKGAELECTVYGRAYNVARSLERVQGPARQQLETYRVVARMAAREEADRVRKIRFEDMQREEERVLLRQTTAVPTEEKRPETKDAEIDSFGNPVDAKSATPSDVKSSEEKSSGEKPADVKSSEEKSSDANPFENSGKATEEKSPEEKAPEAKDSGASAPKKSLFGALGKAIGKTISGDGKKGAVPPVPGNMLPEAMPGGGEMTPEKADPPKKEAEKSEEDAFGSEPASKPAPPKNAPEKEAEKDPFEN